VDDTASSSDDESDQKMRAKDSDNESVESPEELAKNGDEDVDHPVDGNGDERGDVVKARKQERLSLAGTQVAGEALGAFVRFVATIGVPQLLNSITLILGRKTSRSAVAPCGMVLLR